MVKKLKCWKKLKELDAFGGLSRYETKGKRIYITKRNFSVETIPGNRVLVGKDVKSKSQGLKFAKSYMKKHDTCKI